MRGPALLLVVLAVGVPACSGAEPEVSSSPGPASTRVADSTASTADLWTTRRERMVESQIAGRGVADPLVLQALRAVPRHLFVPDDLQLDAYGDFPLPIGYGQTISQPYIVALMSEALHLAAGERVLEIGTGSGYQAAVLAEMGMEVYSIEIIPELAEGAAAHLAAAGYDSVVTRAADGYWGWEEHAPFQGIMVTAAPDHLPEPLIAQLAPGGRMVIPIGPVGAVQTLWSFQKDAAGQLVGQNLGPVRFVPFTRSGG
jgi:protein-L-isoaspartate(D-aspartate) O-methyltransferase